MRVRLACLAVPALLLVGCSEPATSTPTPTATPSIAPSGPVTPPTTEPAMITSAMSAAPEAIAKDATINVVEAK